MISRAMRATGRHMMKSTSVSGEIYGMEHTDGSQSDTALGSLGSGIKKRRSSLSQRVVAILPSRRSRSTSQLSQTGQKNRTRNHHMDVFRQVADSRPTYSIKLPCPSPRPLMLLCVSFFSEKHLHNVLKTLV